VLRYVPATAGESIAVEVSSNRSPQRVDRILSASALAVPGGITKIPDLLLPSDSDSRPPTILAPDRLEVEEGKTLDAHIVVNDPGPGPKPEIAISGVSFASLIRGNGASHTLRLSPNYQQSGDYTLTLTATNNAGVMAKQEIAIFVKDVNRPPSASSQSVTVDQNGQAAIRLDGSDPDGDPLIYKLLSQPARGALTGTTPNLTYRPNANYVGADSFTFRVNDGAVESDTATVSITVRSTNRAPTVTVPGPQSTSENQLLSFNITATDPDAGQTLSLSTSGLPSGAAVTAAAGATGWFFRWTPNFTQSGSYTLNFTATDNGAPPMSNTRSVQITVVDVPVLVVPGAQRVTQGSTLTFIVNASAAAAGIPLTISATNLPSGASISTATGSNVTFRWPTAFNTPTGSYTVTFRAQYSGTPAINESRNVAITVDPFIIGLQQR
jgi:hypothetical protein